jgi:hypothetical protein
VVVSGSLLFSTFLGGSSSESVCGVAVDDTSDRVFVVGDTTSADFPLFGGGSSSLNGARDFFISEWTRDGK